MGHNVPADSWWRGKLRDRFYYLFEKKSFLNDEIYNITKVKELFQRHLEGENHQMFFWQFLNLHQWYQLNFEN